MQDIFHLIMIILYALFLIAIGVFYVKNNIGLKNKYSNKYAINVKKTSMRDDTPLSLFRNQYFLCEHVPDNEFYINAYVNEVFNIFIKLSPSMISTLTKVERRMVGLKTAIENPMANEDYLKAEIEYMDSALDEMVQVSHSMIEKLEENLICNQTDQTKIQLNREAIHLYMNAVNLLMDLTDNHAMINYEIHNRLLNAYPELIDPFRIISGKMTYLFFINLISYSNKIDENIFIQ
jgi:hypothetical protein